MSTPAMISATPVAAVPEDQRPLPLSAKLLYGVGEMPITVLMVISGLFMLFFYNSVMGLPSVWVGVGLSFSLVLDAVLDPFIGHLSDRTSHPFGRRHIYMLPGALIIGPSFFLLFSPPRTLGRGAVFTWMLVCAIALRASSAVYRIPYLSLGAELSRDYDDRTSTMGLRTLFGLMGTLLAGALSFLIFPATTDGSEPRLHYAGYPRLGLVFGAMMTIAGLIGTLGTLRYRTTSGVPASHRRRFFSGFLLAMRNRHFRSIWFSTTVFFLAVVLNFSMAIHYFTWYAHIGRSEVLSLIQTCFYSGAIGGVILWMSLARRTEKRTLYLMAAASSAILLLMATVLVGRGRPLGIGHPLPLIVGHVIGGIFASAVWVMPASMIADVTDTDELATGLRREGIYFGIMNFGEKLAAGGALLFAGGLLGVFRRLSPGQSFGTPGHPPAAEPFVGLLYGAVPAVLLGISMLLILPYRLNRREVHDIQERLAIRRGGAE
jgi:glycoside/pentoside/hexuronide:cation symporter, GPH family